ncbi:MAG: HEAT repeat domain-containing protein [Planctomycetes bacterium]|nr:HEAT repeat domain-containing protein [Planctomycetota bacterium]
MQTKSMVRFTGVGQAVLCIGILLSTAHVAAGSEEIDCAGGLAAWGGPREFDEVHGEDLGRYPPDRLVDVRHVKLELTFDDLLSKSFSGSETYTVRAIAPGVTSIVLNAVDLSIERVEAIDSPAVTFDYDDERLVLEFAEPLPTDRDSSVRIDYRCVNPEQGLHYYLPDERQPQRVPQVHSQGQTEHNRHWFPCHDSPNERSTTEMIVTVPSRFRALSNGRLLDKRVDGEHTTYHWRQDVPHVAYLVTLVIGEFGMVSDTWRGIPLTYYGRPGEEDDIRRAYVRTPEIMEFFSQYFGVPYPYARYDQIGVENFGSGGMENTTATTMYSGVPLDERAAMDHTSDGLIAHEMAHQWYGDLLTCKSWAHLWLNEGFATFCADLWKEHHEGADEHSYAKWRKYRGVARADRTESPDAVIFGDYEDAWDTFRHKGGLPYSKGSSILHMLRHELGEEVFAKGLQQYTRTFQASEVETDDFRKVMEAVAGRSLRQFFEQWTLRPGIPRLKVAYRWDHETKTAIVDVEQTQPIDRPTPAFAVPLDLYFRTDHRETRVTMQLERRHEVLRYRFDSAPNLFCIDPDGGLLKALEVHKSRPMWLTQLAQGPTVAARCEAAVNLADQNRPEVIEALTHTVSNEHEFWGVRSEAASALGQMQSSPAREALIVLADPANRIEHPKVRRYVVNALSSYPHAAVTPILIAYATSDASYAVEAAATSALGDAVGQGVTATLLANTEKHSYRDAIRTAAVRALGKRGEPEGIDACMAVAAYGQPDRTRPAAIRALGELGEEDSDRTRIREFLLPMLDDPERRPRRAAIAALGALADPDAIDALGRLRDGSALEEYRDAAEAAIKRIRSDQEESEAVGSLGRELEDLRTLRDELEQRIEELESADQGDGDPTSADQVVEE